MPAATSSRACSQEISSHSPAPRLVPGLRFSGVLSRSGLYIRCRMDRPRRHERIVRFSRVSSPVLSGSTRVTTPSLTTRRTGQRDPQLTVHALHTTFSPLYSAGVSAASASSGDFTATAPVKAAAPPTAADHFIMVRRENGMATMANAPDRPRWGMSPSNMPDSSRSHYLNGKERLSPWPPAVLRSAGQRGHVARADAIDPTTGRAAEMSGHGLGRALTVALQHKAQDLLMVFEP